MRKLDAEDVATYVMAFAVLVLLYVAMTSS